MRGPSAGEAAFSKNYSTDEINTGDGTASTRAIYEAAVRSGSHNNCTLVIIFIVRIAATSRAYSTDINPHKTSGARLISFKKNTAVLEMFTNFQIIIVE